MANGVLENDDYCAGKQNWVGANSGLEVASAHSQTGVLKWLYLLEVGIARRSSSWGLRKM